MKKQIKEFLEINPIFGKVWNKNQWKTKRIKPSYLFDFFNDGDFIITIPYNQWLYSPDLRKEILWWILEFQRKITYKFQLELESNSFILRKIINK